MGLAVACCLRRVGRSGLPALSRSRCRYFRISSGLRKRRGLSRWRRILRRRSAPGARDSITVWSGIHGACSWNFRRPCDCNRLSPAQGGGGAGQIPLCAIFLLLVSPHYAWYYAWVLPFLCRTVYVPLLYLTLACFVLYIPELEALGKEVHLWRWLYLGFAVLMGIDLLGRYRLLPLWRLT